MGRRRRRRRRGPVRHWYCLHEDSLLDADPDYRPAQVGVNPHVKGVFKRFFNSDVLAGVAVVTGAVLVTGLGLAHLGVGWILAGDCRPHHGWHVGGLRRTP